jgi:hypothetical protein
MELQQEQKVKFSKAGVDFIVDDYVNGGVRYYRARADVPTPKGKYSKSKNVFYYRFFSAQERDAYVEKYIEQVEARLKRIQDAKDAKAAARKEAKNPYKVGDLFYDSWGYDQTNIDFYQIVEVGKMSVKMRAIGKRSVPGTQGFMSEDVSPVKDLFLSDDHYRGGLITSIVQVNVWGGKTSYGIRGYYKDHGYLSKTDETQSHYSSWYA